VHPTPDPDPAPPTAGDGEVVAARSPEAGLRGTPRLPLDVAGTFAIGLGMGAADLVPGFSGGTVALVTGIYERLIANVRQGARALSLLLRLQVRAGLGALGAIEWGFVVALLSGILSAVVALAAWLSGLIETRPVQLSAVFLGLVLGATVVALAELRAPGARHLVIGAVVAAITFVGLGLRSGSVGEPVLPLVFAAGAIAICAMILPGISGSFLLLLLGTYVHVIDAVEAREVVFLGVLALGAVTGLASFSTVLNWALRRHHDVVLAGLLGLMVGSTRVLWPWPSTGGVGDTRLGAPVASEVPMALASAVVAAAAVAVFAALGRRVARAT
jgi:putative membrane protein